MSLQTPTWRARPTLISNQDWAIRERAQTGVSSRAYRTGVYPRKDRFLFDFKRYRVEMGRPTLG